jgi:lantibiotic modifying enzyme
LFGIDVNIEAEQLLAPFLVAESIPETWSLLMEEQRSLCNFDIPYFTAGTDKVHWEDGNGVSNIFLLSGKEFVLRNFARLSQNDLHFQQSLIRASLFLVKETSPSPARSYAHETKLKEFDHGNFIDGAIRIADYIVNSAACSDSHLTWIGLEPKKTTGDFFLQTLSSDLYNGQPGIALFFAALARITGASVYKHHAISSLSKYLDPSFGEHESVVLDAYCGAGVGRTSLAYAMYNTGLLLSEYRLVDRAQQLLSKIHMRDLDRYKEMDLVSGLAGEALLLRKFHPEIAADCVYRIASVFEITEVNQQHVSASHGLSGILLALESVGIRDRTIKRMIVTIENAIDSIWIPEKRNWVSQQDKKSYKSWAHGSLGVALCLLHSRRNGHMDKIELVAQRLQEEGQIRWDNLANGNAAYIDFWLAYGRRDLALNAASRLASRKNVVDYSVPGPLNFGLFSGLSGIGYSLLRATAPEVIPSVLNWQFADDKI